MSKLSPCTRATASYNRVMLARVWVLIVLATASIAQPLTPAQLVAEANKANDAGDRAKALRLATQAIAMNPPPAVRAEALALSCWTSSEPAASIAAANEGLRIALAGKRHAQLLSCRGNALENSGRLDDAEKDYDAARREAERIGDQKVLSDALAQLGYLRYFRGDFHEALKDLQRCYAISQAIGRDANRRLALAYIAHIYADAKVGQYAKAIEYYQQLLAEYKATGNKTGVADTLFNLGSTCERKGDLSAALVWFRRALAMEQELGRAAEAAFVKRSIGMTLQKLDRPAEALPPFDQAAAYFAKSKDEDRLQMVLASRAIAYRKLGRLDEAIRDLESARAYFESTKNMRFLEKTQDDLALAYAAKRQWEKAFRARTAHADLQRALAEKMREENTTRLRVQFDLEREEQENRALIKENQHRARLLDAAARIRRLQTVVLVLSAITILALVFLVVKHLRDARRMRVMAMTDELTRLPNRRHLLADAEELLRTRSGQDTFSLIAFDIDHFKRINDTWGHAAGDLVLQRVAHACRGALRPTDRIGRTGGEEFTVLLPSTRVPDAMQIAERLRTAVESIDCGDIDPALRVTISLGVAEWSQSDATIAKLAGRADHVLYRAKQLGRNRVELATA